MNIEPVQDTSGAHVSLIDSVFNAIINGNEPKQISTQSPLPASPNQYESKDEGTSSLFKIITGTCKCCGDRNVDAHHVKCSVCMFACLQRGDRKRHCIVRRHMEKRKKNHEYFSKHGRYYWCVSCWNRLGTLVSPSDMHKKCKKVDHLWRDMYQLPKD